jgi:hypothetical protein
LTQLPGIYQTLSNRLLAAFPSQKDVDYLYETGGETLMFFQNLIKKSSSTTGLDSTANANNFPEILPSHTHPVIIAQKLLVYAIFIQHLTHEEASGLSEPVQVLVRRLGDAARMISTNDDLVGTIEGLECVMLEGTFQANCGNLRKAWLAGRRAISIAQLMGIDHKADASLSKANEPGEKFNPHSMWFRLVYVDHFLCLLLGIPNSIDHNTLSEDVSWNDDAMSAKLKRMHIKIAARILQRNHNRSLQEIERREVTEKLDKDLLQAAKSMPDDFWRPPNFFGLKRHSLDAMSEAVRLSDQIFHYSLLIQLHLPFLLRFSAEGRCEYSNVACVNASREVLTLFITYRTFNRVASACRFSDFLSLMAAMTLLLSHLESHRRQGSYNILAHQRLGDRAMMKQVLENMELISKLNADDVLMDKSACLLRQLLDIEAEAADGRTYSAEKVAEDHEESEGHVLILSVPYFGTIRFAREGIATTRDKQQADPIQMHMLNGNELSVSTALNSTLSQDCTIGIISYTQPDSNQLMYDNDNMQTGYPGFAANLDDWTFQGVDGAFFDSLMKGQVMSNLPDDSGGANLFRRF